MNPLQYVTLAFFLAIGLPAVPFTATAQEQGELKLHAYGNLPLLVEGKIGAHLGFFQVGTGTNITCIDKKFASLLPTTEAAKIAKTGTDQIVGMEIHELEPGHIQIGHFMFQGMVATLDLEAERSTHGVPIFGIVGMNWMRGYHMHFDFENERVLLSKNPLPIPTEGWIPLPIFWTEARTPILRVPIAGETAKFKLYSTNSDVMEVPDGIFQKLTNTGLLTGAEEIEFETPNGLLMRRSAIVVPFFDFLGLSYPAFRMYASRDNTGYMGLGMLRQYSVIFDFPTEMCYLRPLREGKAVIHHAASDLLLGHLAYTGDGQPPLVGQLYEGSPLTKAGVRKGDRILQLGPKTGGDLDNYWLSKFLNEEQGTEIQIRFQRDGESFDGTFTASETSRVTP